jgi:hypothetical protein
MEALMILLFKNSRIISIVAILFLSLISTNSGYSKENKPSNPSKTNRHPAENDNFSNISGEFISVASRLSLTISKGEIIHAKDLDSDIQISIKRTTCFTAGTMIDTPRGKVAIETLKIGDVVYSFDIDAQQVMSSKVTATFAHANQPVGKLNVGDRVLNLTANHPLYVANSKQWLRADEINNQDVLLVKSQQNHLEQIKVKQKFKSLESTANVYNIEVEGNHNYFAEGILVHNKRSKP